MLREVDPRKRERNPNLDQSPTHRERIRKSWLKRKGTKNRYSSRGLNIFIIFSRRRICLER